MRGSGWIRRNISSLGCSWRVLAPLIRVDTCRPLGKRIRLAQLTQLVGSREVWKRNGVF